MPNWVFNHLSIQGNTLDIKRVKKQVGASFTREYADSDEVRSETFDNPVFAFWNISKPTDMNAYLHDKPSGVPDNPNDPDAWFQSNNWYDWNVRNWGTKWDVAVSNIDMYPETELVDEGDSNINYRFDTAWSPPLGAIKTLSEQHPNVVFTLDYEEETSWGGEVTFRNGVMEQTTKYEYRCECGEEWTEEPELDDDGQCPKCEEV